MKIAHVVYSCSPGSFRGGVSKMVNQLALAQAAAGHEVKVIAFDREQSDFSSGGVDYVYLPSFKIFGSCFSESLAHYIDSLGVDWVIHSHNTFHFLNVQLCSYSKRKGNRLFYHSHGALDYPLLTARGMRGFKKRVYVRLFELPALNSAKGLIALNRQERDSLLRIGVNVPVAVIPNGIEMPPNACAMSNSDKLVMLYVGRIAAKKRIEHIIEALSFLVRQGIRTELDIVGNYDEFPGYHSFLRGQIEQLGVGSHIRWHGFKNESEKAGFYSRSGVFVHASESEGMAMAILEAMARGIPVVASSGCYMSAAADAGALIEYSSGPEALSKALAELVAMSHDKRRDLGLAGRRYAELEHSWPAIVSYMVKFYADPK